MRKYIILINMPDPGQSTYCHQVARSREEAFTKAWGCHYDLDSMEIVKEEEI